MRFSLNPRDSRLMAFLTAPRSLAEDPTWLKLRARINEARAKHRPVRQAEAELAEYVQSLLRKGGQ